LRLPLEPREGYIRWKLVQIRGACYRYQGGEHGMSQGANRWRPALLLVLATAGLIWGGWKWSQAWRYRNAMARIEEELELGFLSTARKDLVELQKRYPGKDQVAFLLGSCEKALGRPEEAALAWAKVPRDSTFAFHALEGRVELALELGRLSEAEQLVIKTCEDSPITGEDPMILLGAIYCQQGRVNEAMRLIEALWRRHDQAGVAASETAINQLWLYIQLQSNPVGDDTIRTILERAGQVAPDDDRVWLWKAKLAIRTRSYDEAATWIDQCLKRRPNDVAVWRTRLDWAVATNRLEVARAALKYLPAAEFTAAQVEKLAAWFGVQSGDDDAERRSLERLIVADPTDVAAFDRLIELCVKNGQSDVADALRGRKVEIARLVSRYQKLFKRHQPRRDAAEMGRLAEQLGRPFEARAFLTLALAGAPERPESRGALARLAHSGETTIDSTRTLDDVLAVGKATDKKN
jgi:enediyne biosynthesis protein E4